MKYLLGLLLVTGLQATAQVKPKIVGECTVEFTVAMGDQPTGDNKASMILYIKGQQSRLDFISPAYTQVKYYDARTHTGAILQDLGATKVKREIDSLKWKRLNERYEGFQVAFEEDTKVILGYETKKATILLKDGSSYTLYYAPAIIPSTREYEYQFRNIPGLVLEYETVADGSNQKVRYTATKINLSPVPAARFELPKSGYRVL